MKYLYRISLTFMLLTIASATVLSGCFIYQMYKTNTKQDKAYENDAAKAAANDLSTTDCDTEYVILEQDLVTGQSLSLVQEIPAKYIGKTKEQLVSLLSQEEKAPSLRDRQKGIVSIRLSAFSGERVVVVKTYETAETSETAKIETWQKTTGLTALSDDNDMPDDTSADTGSENESYYLMACNGYVCAYRTDMKTLYLSTGISLDQLPDQVRQEILDKKYIKNEEELYNFLESYSS